MNILFKWIIWMLCCSVRRWLLEATHPGRIHSDREARRVRAAQQKGRGREQGLQRGGPSRLLPSASAARKYSAVQSAGEKVTVPSVFSWRKSRTTHSTTTRSSMTAKDRGIIGKGGFTVLICTRGRRGPEDAGGSARKTRRGPSQYLIYLNSQ